VRTRQIFKLTSWLQSSSTPSVLRARPSHLPSFHSPKQQACKIMIRLELTSSCLPLPPLPATSSSSCHCVTPLYSVVDWATAILRAPNSSLFTEPEKSSWFHKFYPPPSISHLNPLHRIVPSVFDINCSTTLLFALGLSSWLLHSYFPTEDF
jgi:hypothetical protein